MAKASTPRSRSRRPQGKAAARGTKKVAVTARARASAGKPARSAPRAAKWVYAFGGGKAEGRADMRNLLGGKGAGLAEMTNLGLPVPPGFTITTDVCKRFYQEGERLPQGLEAAVKEALARVEKVMGARFGDAANPLLLSVRSGARVSMPGMMDTILNLGLNDKTVEGLIKRTDNPRFAYDSYRRLVAMYGDVVLGMKPESKHAP